MNATLRPASPLDVERIVQLMQGYYAEDGYAFDGLAARSAVDGLLSRAEFGQAWCVEVAGQVVGYFVLTLGYSFEYHGVDGFLDELYLLPGCRGKGIGKAAIACAENKARLLGVRALHLEVERDKPETIGRYRSWGFVDGRRLLMTKLLQTAPLP